MSRKRIAVGGIEHETAGLLPGETPLSVFQRRRVSGDELVTRSGEANTVVDGFLHGARQRGWEVSGLLWIKGTSGPPASKETFDVMLAELLDDLDAAGQVDGVLLSLHGSFATHEIDDADGAVLQAVRDRIGPDIPLMSVHDMHCNLTHSMIEPADALAVMRTYPHVDMRERALHIAGLMERTLAGELQPTMGFRQLPLLWSAPRMIDAEPPMSEAVARIEESDNRPGVVSASLGVGYQWVDSPAVGASAVVVTNDNLVAAQDEADAMAEWVWRRRADWVAPTVRPADALQLAETQGAFPIVLADQADNTGGGAPGDGTEVLRLFIEKNLSPAVVLYIVDPVTAAQAHEAGVGAMIEVAIGGRSHPNLGPPVAMRARVEATGDGNFVYDGPMWKGVADAVGPTAWLQADGVSVVVISLPQQPVDLALCRSLGMVVTDYRYICVKSTGHFRSGFEPIAGTIVNVDAKGLLGQSFADLPYKRLGRPMFPIDEYAVLGFTGAPESPQA
ncbi:MAG: M81 family metallopeptidase [Planctomycetota bacterium]|nr:M81 family metallopeptidase [Planctomycetota bacterium]